MLHSAHYPSYWSAEEENQFDPSLSQDMNEYLRSINFTDKLLFKKYAEIIVRYLIIE
jgi:hypothetical protein